MLDNILLPKKIQLIDIFWVRVLAANSPKPTPTKPTKLLRLEQNLEQSKKGNFYMENDEEK